VSFRYTEDWSTGGYVSMIPVREGHGLFSKLVMPVEISFRALLRETATRALLLLVGLPLLLIVASWLQIDRQGFMAIFVLSTGFATWLLWKSIRLPHRQRVIASRDRNELVIVFTSGNRRPLRLDLGGVRYAWLEQRFYKESPIGWVIRFGRTLGPAEGWLTLPLFAVSDIAQYLLHGMLLYFIGDVFEHIGALTPERRRELIESHPR
jgi:hypothetical protein